MRTTLRVFTILRQTAAGGGPFFHTYVNLSCFHRIVLVPEPYQAGTDPEPFDHHERGHNRTIWINRAPTMDY